MCLTALKNSLVLGNCQPIISTPSSGLSLALHIFLAHSVCAFISLHLSLSLCISFSLLIQPPSSHLLSQTLFQIPSIYIYILAIPCPWTHNHCYIFVVVVVVQPFTKASCEWSTCFSKLFPHSVLPQLFHSVKHHQMPLIRS